MSRCESFEQKKGVFLVAIVLREKLLDRTLHFDISTGN
jgi:hypothetical protein